MLDPSEAPATGTRVRGGLTLRSKCPELTETFGRWCWLLHLTPSWSTCDLFWACRLHTMLMKLQGGSPAGPLGKLHRTSCCCWYGWGSLSSGSKWYIDQQTFSWFSCPPSLIIVSLGEPSPGTICRRGRADSWSCRQHPSRCPWSSQATTFVISSLSYALRAWNTFKIRCYIH